MAYKYKPCKAMVKRFRVTRKGKLKHNHTLTSHLRSGRSGNKKRHLRRASILFEGHARNIREFMGVSKLKPARIEHEARLAAQAEAKAEAQA